MEVAKHIGTIGSRRTMGGDERARVDLEMGARRRMNICGFAKGGDVSLPSQQDAARFTRMRSPGSGDHGIQSLSCNEHVHRAWT